MLSFAELSGQCSEKDADGFECFMAELKVRTEARIRSGETNYPQATIDMMTEVLDWSGLTEPFSWAHGEKTSTGEQSG